MTKARAKMKIVFAIAVASVMPLLTFACSGNDPLLGLRGPNPPGPDTGRPDTNTNMEGSTPTEGGDAPSSDAPKMDAPADTTMPPADTGIDTGVDTGADTSPD